MSATLWPHGLQHTRLPCPSPTPRASSNSCPLSWWCILTIIKLFKQQNQIMIILDFNPENKINIHETILIQMLMSILWFWMKTGLTQCQQIWCSWILSPCLFWNPHCYLEGILDWRATDLIILWTCGLAWGWGNRWGCCNMSSWHPLLLPRRGKLTL